MSEALTRTSLTDSCEETYFAVAVVFSILIWLPCVLLVIPILYALIFAGFLWLGNGLLVAQLKTNAVRVQEASFPALAGTFARVCEKLQLARVPELYVVQSQGTLNAFATRHCGRNFVVVLSDMLEAYGADSAEMEFLLGHEIGHIQRSHLQKRLLLFPGLLLPLLGNAYRRACELTCDRYGAYAARSLQGAVQAMMVLAGGKPAARDMSAEAFARQYAEHRGFFVSWSELISAYPTLARRVANLVALRDGVALPRAPRHPIAYPFAFCTMGGGSGGTNLLLTVMVVAMLAAIAIPSFMKARESALRAREAAQEERAADVPARAVAE